MNRRDVLALLGVTAIGSVLPAVAGASELQKTPRIFDVRTFGAVGDGQTLDSAAINRTIAAAADSGGTVYVSPGTYLCGTLVLKSNVTLYLESTAVILGSTNPSDYTLMRGPGIEEDAGQRHLIFARDAENITLAGPGTVDGQGAHFWTPNGHVPGSQFVDVTTFRFTPSKQRPSPLLEFYNCKTVRIQDIRIQNAAGWTLRPIQCRDVFIDGITIKNPIYGPNTDGIDPTCCTNVFISNCLIETGDDAICIKSEAPYGGEPAISKNITITNCVLSGCCNGLKFGTPSFGGFENVVFSNSVIYNNDVPPSERIISGIAIEIVDGGYVDGVMISNIRMQRTRNPVFVRRGARHPTAAPSKNFLRGVMIENVHASGSLMTSCIAGLPGAPIEDIVLSNIRIDSDDEGTAQEASRRDIPEVANLYPEIRMFGRLSAHGLYARHVKGLRVRNVEFKPAVSEARPAIVCEDVHDLEIDNLRTTPIAGESPVIRLIQSAEVSIRNCRAPVRAATFLEVAGGDSRAIVLSTSELTSATQRVALVENAPASAVTEFANLT